jgi:hypothetical protein
MPCMECPGTLRVECGDDPNELCTGGGTVTDLGVAYVPVGLGSVYLAIDVLLATMDDGSCKVYLYRHQAQSEPLDRSRAPLGSGNDELEDDDDNGES